jgi:radical SAM superfamily enzyme YgiQ (UPF0313 family)
MTAGATAGREKILLVELTPTVPNLGRFIVMPRYGLLAIASILADKTDYYVKLLYEPYVGRIDAEKIAREDPRYLLINGLTTSAHDNERLIESFRNRTRGTVPVITGGEHASVFPEDAKRYADYVLAYEADETVVSLLEALEEEDPVSRDSMLSQVPGLHYRDLSGTWRFNREPSRVERIDYRYDFSLLPGSESAAGRFRTAHLPLQTSRGCKHVCSFCSWISLYGKSGYHVRPVEDVLHDMVHAIGYTGIRNFIVTDNLFAGDAAYTEELMHEIIRVFEGRPDKPAMTVLCRADQFTGGPGALPEKVIKLMARGGVANVSMGLESINSRSLLQMRKRTDLEKYYLAADTLRRNGIGMLATFVAGFDGDSYEDVVNIAEFGERIGLFTVQVYARGIMPGTVDEILSAHRNIPGRLDKYVNGHTVNILPALMLPSDLQRAIFDAAFRFHSTGDRRSALSAFRFIWRGIEPHLEGLLRLEREILIPEKIYKKAGSGYLLDEKALNAFTEDEERRLAFAKRSAEIFRDAELTASVRRRIPTQAVSAIA